MGYKNTNVKIIFCIIASNKGDEGGFMYSQISNSFIEITKTNFMNNYAYYNGGVFMNYQESTYLNIYSSFFLNNTALNAGVIYLNLNNYEIIIKTSYFFLNSGKTGGLIDIGIYNEAITFESCFAESNVAYQFGGGLYSEYYNLNIYIIKCIFASNNALTGGGVIYLTSENQIIVDDCFFVNNYADDGGVLYLGNKNLNVAFSFSTFILNSAMRGGVGFSNSTSFAKFNYNKFAKNEAHLVIKNFELNFAQTDFFLKLIQFGGLVYLNYYSQLIFEKATLVSTSAFIFGGILLIDQYSRVSFNNSKFLETYSRIGASFYLADNTTLSAVSSIFSIFESTFRTYGLLRADGLNINFLLTKCKFQNFSDFLFDDIGAVKILIVLINNTVLFSNKYDKEGIFLLQSVYSSLEANSNFFIFETKRKLLYFINCLESEIKITINKNFLPYSIFSCLIEVYQMKNVVILLNNSKVNPFQGNLVNVFEYVTQTSDFSNSISKISILNCEFLINKSSKHYLNLKSVDVLTVKNTTLLIDSDQVFSFIFQRVESKIREPAARSSSILLVFCNFLAFSHKIEVLDSSRASSLYSFIEIENSFDDIVLNRSIFKIGRKIFLSLLKIGNSSNINILHTVFIGNVLKSGSSSVIIKFHRPCHVSITYSQFICNVVDYGGILAFDNYGLDSEPILSLVFRKNKIQQIKATVKGGLLFINSSITSLENSTLFAQKLYQSILKKENYFTKIYTNTIGQLLFWEGSFCPSYKEILQIFGIDSKSSLPGLIASTTRFFNVIKQSLDDIQLGNKINLKKKVVNNYDHKSSPYFCFISFDYFNQTVIQPSDRNLNDFRMDFNKIPEFFEEKQLKSEIIQSFVFYRGLICLSKIIIKTFLQESLGKQARLLTYSNEFRFLINYFDFSPIKKAFYEIELEFDDCKPGEVFNSTDCIPCERNKFSDKKIIGNPYLCRICSDYDPFFCYGGNFRSPKRNFWRFNDKSYDFLRCPGDSCLGDLDFERNFTNIDCASCFLPGSDHKDKIFSFDPNHTANGLCAKGYTGILCTECQRGFGSADKYKCTDCSSFVNYIKQGIFLLIKLTLFFFSNWLALKNTVNANIDIKSPEFIEDITSSYMLKILFRHFANLAVLKTLPFEFDVVFDETLSASINIFPSENFEIFSFECLLRFFQIKTPPIFFELYVSLIFYCLSFFLIFLFFTLKNLKRPVNLIKVLKTLRLHILGCTLIFLMDNIILILGPFIKVLFCINIGDDKQIVLRIQKSLSLNCWDSIHRSYVLGMSMPTIIIIAIITPAFILFKIFRGRRKGKLWTDEFLRNYGYFIFPYREGKIYYEILIIFYKIVILSLKEIFIYSIILNKDSFAILVLFCVLIMLYSILKFLRPYRREKYYVLQKVETFSLIINISNSLLAIIWNLLGVHGRDLAIAWLIVTYVCLSNIMFILFWFSRYFNYLKQKVKLFLKWINSYFYDKSLKIKNSKGRFESVTSRRDLINEIQVYKREIEKLKVIVELLKQHINHCNNSSDTVNSTPNSQKKSIEEENYSVKIDSVGQPYSFENNEEPSDITYTAEIIEKEWKGKSLTDFFIYLKYKIAGVDELSIDVKSLDFQRGQDWIVSYNWNDMNKEMIIALKKLSPWAQPPFNFKFKLSFSILKAREIFHKNSLLELSYDLDCFDYVKYSTSQWKIHEPDLEIENCIFSKSLGKKFVEKVFECGEDQKNLRGEINITSPLLDGKSYTFDIEINRRGFIDVYGKIDENTLKEFWANFFERWISIEI